MTIKEIKEKLEEMLRELDNYPQEEINDTIDLYVNTWANCTKEQAIFLIGFEKGIQSALNIL